MLISMTTKNEEKGKGSGMKGKWKHPIPVLCHLVVSFLYQLALLNIVSHNLDR